MIGIISGIVFLLFALVALVLQRLLSSVPRKELKRLARQGDPLAKALYRPVSYGASMRLLLWIVAGVGMSSGLLLLTSYMPAIADFALVAFLIVVMVVWAPSIRLTVHSARFAAFLSPAVAWAMSYLHMPLSIAAGLVGRYRDIESHSRLYEKEDLLGLLDLQKKQADNRIVHADLDLVGRALVFDDKHAADIVKSHKDALLVNADETLGPILLDQLHKSGQSSFLAYKDEKENIIGSLSLRDAVKARQDIRVFDLIRHDLTFVHEDFSLRQVLAALQQTGQHVAVVVNRFEEFLGTITLDDVLEQLVGKREAATVEVYDDRASVASYKPAEKTSADDESSSPESTEVIE
jgi:CBS domain containing-hemolysin-like protein